MNGAHGLTDEAVQAVRFSDRKRAWLAKEDPRVHCLCTEKRALGRLPGIDGVANSSESHDPIPARYRQIVHARLLCDHNDACHLSLNIYTRCGR